MRNWSPAAVCLQQTPNTRALMCTCLTVAVWGCSSNCQPPAFTQAADQEVHHCCCSATRKESRFFFLFSLFCFFCISVPFFPFPFFGFPFWFSLWCSFLIPCFVPTTGAKWHHTLSSLCIWKQPEAVPVDFLVVGQKPLTSSQSTSIR